MTDDTNARILTALTRIEGRLDQFDGRLARIEGRLDRFDARFERIEGRLDQLEAAQDKLRADLTGQFTRLRADVMERVDRSQDVLTLQRDELTVNFSSGERAERIAKAAQQEVSSLSEVIGAMHRQISRLQSDVRQLKGEP